jgi:hypothetical protein
MEDSLTFAILTEYKKRSSGIDLYVHAVMIVKEKRQSTIKTHIYNNNSDQLRATRDDNLKSFLEKTIPENYEVYASDGYYPKHAQTIDRLRQQFTIREIDSAPVKIQGDIVHYFSKIIRTLSIRPKIRK